MQTVELTNFTCPHCGRLTTAILSEESGIFCDSCRQDLAPAVVVPALAGLTTERGLRIACGIIAQGKPNKITLPSGWQAGRQVSLPQALQDLALEIWSHLSNLRERPHKDPRESAAQLDQALERYALIVWLIWLQAEPDWQQHMSGSLAGLLELAPKHGLTLPADLEALARKHTRL